MMSGNPTPSSLSRPRPPAKIRRGSAAYTAASASPPPPPYGSSTFAFPAKRGTLLAEPTPDEHDSWMDEKSREELSEMLIRADSIIKDRESELNMTSATCRTLRSTNAALRSKHDVLLARHGMSSGSPPVTPIQTPHLYANTSLPGPRARIDSHYSTSSADSSFSAGSSSYFSQAYSSGSGRKHVRKISISPLSIAQLSDQNAELLMKLEALESDQSAARALRKLEREIRGLREELDATQRRGEELEHNVNHYQMNRREEEQELRKQKEDELKALRRSTSTNTPGASLQAHELRDFAPRSSIPSPESTSITTSAHGITPQPALEDALSSLTDDVLSASPSTHSLISTLISKIAELELTNTQILEQQQSTSEQLKLVQRETEGMSRVYELLNPDDDRHDGGDYYEDNDDRWEIQIDENELVDSDSGVIRFGSLRRQIDQSLSMSLSNNKELQGNVGHDVLHLEDDDNDFFDSGMLGPSRANPMMQSTIRGPKGRTRGSVAELFKTGTLSSSSRNAYPPPDNDGVPSPTRTLSLSSLGLETSSNTPFSSLFSGQTLDNELAGADWSMLDDDRKYHLRGTSLYDMSLRDLTGVNNSRSSSRSTSPSPLSGEQQQQHRREFQRTSHSHSTSPLARTVSLPVPMQESEIQPRRDLSDGVETSSPVPAPAISLEPPTPDKSALLNNSSTTQHISPSTARYRRMSHTVRMRTGQWVDGRFGDTLLSPPSKPRQIRGGKGKEKAEVSDTESDSNGGDNRTPRAPFDLPLPLPKRLVNAFGAVSDLFNGVPEHSGDETNGNTDVDDDGDANVHSNQTVELFVRPSPVKGTSGGGTPSSSKGSSLTKLMLEVWLWLQFVIIIMVFVWAMAKRGPKTILTDAAAGKGRSNTGKGRRRY